MRDMPLTAKDIAEYFLLMVDEEAGDSLSNLKLQKLVYYAQGYHLALHNAPLFQEQIEAWEHGPVIPSLYKEYRGYGSNPIPKPEEFDLEKYDGQVRELLNEVFEVYGQFSAAKLRNMTHAEKPWVEANRISRFATIDQEVMRSYFKAQLVDAQAQDQAPEAVGR